MREIYNRSSVNNGLNPNRKKRYRWFEGVSLFLMVLVGTSGFAQVSDYVFSQSSGTYTSIANNGVLVTGSDATYSTNNDTQGWSVTLPFSFKFNNIHYTSIYVNSNGGATFGNVNSTASSLISSISSYSGAIAVMNRDLWGVFVTGGKTTSGSNVITNVVSFEGIRTNVYIASGAGIQENTYIVGYDTAAKTITMSKNATSSFTNAAVRCGSGRILLKVDGVSPNRTFTIQWEGYNDNHTEPVGSNYLSFQLKLIEGTHQIQMVYGNYYSINTSPRDTQVGLRGVSNTDFNNRAGAVTNSWLNTSAGTSNAATVSRNHINFPASGLTFTWTPTVTTTIPNCITASAITPTNNATGVTNKVFTWPVASGGVSGYKLYVGSNESASNLINGLDVGDVLTHTSTTINYLPNTPYFWKVVPYNEFGDAMDCTIWKFTSLNVPNCPTITFPAANATNVVRNTTLTWTAPTNPSATSYDVYLGTSSNPGFVTNVTGTTYSPSAMLANTTYYWKVVSRNVMGGSQECVLGSFTTGPNLVYCTPSSSDWNTYINNFSTSLGTTNISNLNSGYYTDGYQNNYNQSTVTSNPTGTFNYNFSVVGGTLGAAIWIDWNSSGTFDTYERVFVTTSYGSGPYSGTITIPAGTALGDYRMRVMVDYDSSAPNNPCMTNNPRTETEDYKITVSAAPIICLVPTALVSSNVAITTATLSWTASPTNPSSGYDIYYSTVNTAPIAVTTPTVNNHTSSLLNATGLAAASTYYWWVRSDCGTATSAWTYGGSFITGKAPATVPYFDDFAVNNYSFVNGTQPHKWFFGSATGNTGNSIYISSDEGATNVYNISLSSVAHAYRDIVVPSEATVAAFSFDWKAFGENNYDYIRVWAVPVTFIPTEGVQITTGSGRIQIGGNFGLANNWQTYMNGNLNLSSFAGQTMRLVFEWRNDNSQGLQSPAAIDNVSLIIPSCVAPTALVASNMTAETAALSWGASTSNPSNGYDVYYSTVNTAPLLETLPTVNNHSTNVLNATGLNASSTYYWWVRSDCGGETSLWIYGGVFDTSCLPAIAPTSVENFDAFNGIAPSPACWSEAKGVLAANTILSGTSSGWSLNTNGFANINASNKGVSINLYSNKNEWIISPQINLGSTAGMYRLKYRYAVTGYNNTSAVSDLGTHKVNVVLSTDGGTTWSNANSLKEYTGNAQYSTTGAYEYINLTNYSGVVKIAFVATTSTNIPDIDFHIDDFSIEGIPEWTGMVNSAWDVAGNWSDNSVPTATSNVIVNSANPLVILSDVTVSSIAVGPLANVTVNGTLNVGNITVALGGQMIVANDAAVLQTNEAVNTGLVSVKRNSSPLFRQDYTLWSSPVTGQKLRTFSTQTLFNRFSSYDTAAGTIGSYLQEIVTTADMNTKTFTSAKGYLIRMPNNWVEVGSSNPAQPYLGSFTGTLNNGAVSIPLSGANNKLNLVGNPYASPISIAAFFAANTNIDEILYFWRKKGSELSGASGYATYTSLGIVSADGSINGTTPTNIEVGQGFFVVANSAAPGNLVFNNTMRNNGAATFYKGATETNELHRLWLNLSSANELVGQALIGYKTNATQGVDAGVDALYFNDSPTALTSLINNAEYIIQGRSVPFVNTDIVPLGFKSNVAGSYTISLSHFDGLFAENQDIFLKDKVTGTLNNLKETSYTFTTIEGIFNERFEVHYANTTLGTNNPMVVANPILIGVKDQKITINAGAIVMNKIELIDVTGRVIYTQDGVNATAATLEQIVPSNQMLIVRINTKEKGVVTQKIIF